MSARRTEAPVSISEAVAAEISTVTEANALSEAATVSLTSPENPLERRLAISIRSSINELCLNSAKGTWSPSPEALKSIFQRLVITDKTRLYIHPVDSTGCQTWQHKVHLPHGRRGGSGRPQINCVALDERQPRFVHLSHFYRCQDHRRGQRHLLVDGPCLLARDPP